MEPARQEAKEMTRPTQSPRRKPVPAPPRPKEAREAIRQVVEAVCSELGVSARQRARRAAIEQRIIVAYNHGPRQPLDLVRAGLEG